MTDEQNMENWPTAENELAEVMIKYGITPTEAPIFFARCISRILLDYCPPDQIWISVELLANHTRELIQQGYDRRQGGH